MTTMTMQQNMRKMRRSRQPVVKDGTSPWNTAQRRVGRDCETAVEWRWRMSGDDDDAKKRRMKSSCVHAGKIGPCLLLLWMMMTRLLCARKALATEQRQKTRNELKST